VLGGGKRSRVKEERELVGGGGGVGGCWINVATKLVWGGLGGGGGGKRAKGEKGTKHQATKKELGGAPGASRGGRVPRPQRKGGKEESAG